MRGLDWSNERFVRLYTRDGAPWAVLPWEARALYPQILRIADHRGIIECADINPAEAVGLLLSGWPPSVIGDGLLALAERGWVILAGQRIEVAEFSASQMGAQPEARARLVKAKPRHVYLMRSEKLGLYKIGFSKHPEERAKQVAWQHEAGPVEVVTSCATVSYRQIERLYHGIFERESKGGEWFDLTADQFNFVTHTLTDVDGHRDDLEAALAERDHIEVVVERRRAELLDEGAIA